ncbi:hypothetical protein L798_08511 [Zootermopsis nevadensis]|uniref:Uncharacterized protein n=1 Tax=Zootermopsis nevadensis TaxID=136037 RepID=A0A067R333_ZOONE|nr:hypothetical protein L798_08511 [Zootermopsis nevadensis]
MKIKVENIYTAGRSSDSSVPPRDVTSLDGPKVNVPKFYKEALTSARGCRPTSAPVVIVPPKTTTNEVYSELTVVPGLSVTSTRVPKSYDVTVTRKKKVEKPGSATLPRK